MALQDRLPGFFTPYAYVRYLTDGPLRMTGKLRPEDLRQSEQGLLPARSATDEPEAA